MFFLCQLKSRFTTLRLKQFFAIVTLSYLAGCGVTPRQAGDRAERIVLNYAINTSDPSIEKTVLSNITVRQVGRDLVFNGTIAWCASQRQLCFQIDGKEFPFTQTSDGYTATLAVLQDRIRISLRGNNTATVFDLNTAGIAVYAWHYTTDGQDEARADIRYSELQAYLQNSATQIYEEGERRAAEALSVMGNMVQLAGAINGNSNELGTSASPGAYSSPAIINAKNCIRTSTRTRMNDVALYNIENTCSYPVIAFYCNPSDSRGCPSEGMAALYARNILGLQASRISLRPGQLYGTNETGIRFNAVRCEENLSCFF